MENKIQVLLNFGMLAPTLMDQLEAQSLPYDPKKIKVFQADIVALNRLRFRNLILESAARKGFDKINKQIILHIESGIKSNNKTKPNKH